MRRLWLFIVLASVSWGLYVALTALSPRFAYEQLLPATHGAPYTGEAFFDYVVIWLEFGPWLVALLVEFCLRKWPGIPEKSSAM